MESDYKHEDFINQNYEKMLGPPDVGQHPPTAAGIVLTLVEQLAVHANNLAERAVKTLDPVCRPERPGTISVPGPGTDVLPPLFAALHERLETIGKALQCIERVIQRVDL